MENFDLSDWFAVGAYVLLAAVGGLLGYTTREMAAGVAVKPGRALLEALSSGFVGFLVLLLCLASGVHILLTGFLVGFSGWLGASVTISLLERKVRERLDLGDKPEGGEV